MTINELHIQFDLQSENRIDILKNVAKKCNEGYLFVDSLNGHCYLFDENGNEDDIKKIKRIVDFTFWSCENLESIIIPDSVKSIRDGAFSYCRNLKSIEIHDSVKSIGYEAFWNCQSLKSVSFKGKTFNQIKNMYDYHPWGIKDESIIKCI